MQGKSSEAFSTKTPPHISPSNFSTRFWVVAGPKKWLEVNSPSQRKVIIFPLSHRSPFYQTLLRDFLKALETTTAIKRCKISCNSSGDCSVSDLSFHGRCIARSLQDSAEVVISRLLARNCRSLAVVVSAVFASRRWPFASQRWPGGEVVISRSSCLPLWGVGRLNWDTQKS